MLWDSLPASWAAQSQETISTQGRACTLNTAHHSLAETGFQRNPITKEGGTESRQLPSVHLTLHAALTAMQPPAPHCSCCMSIVSPGGTHRFTYCMLTLHTAASILRCSCHYYILQDPFTHCIPLITSTPLCSPRVSSQLRFSSP